MSVDSVNRSGRDWGNIMLNTALSTAAAGGIGATCGYLTKPYLEGDVPSDEFVKRVEAELEANPIKETVSKEVENVVKKTVTDSANEVKNAQNSEELKKLNEIKKFFEDSIARLQKSKTKADVFDVIVDNTTRASVEYIKEMYAKFGIVGEDAINQYLKEFNTSTSKISKQELSKMFQEMGANSENASALSTLTKNAFSKVAEYNSLDDLRKHVKKSTLEVTKEQLKDEPLEDIIKGFKEQYEGYKDAAEEEISKLTKKSSTKVVEETVKSTEKSEKTVAVDVKKKFEEFWDKSAKEFKDATGETDKKIVNIFKEQVKSMKKGAMKYYGFICASIAGLGCLAQVIFSKNKES